MMAFKNIEALIDRDGQITPGYMKPLGCVAVANDEDNMLAMLKRRPKEPPGKILQRPDQAIEKAVANEEFIDEISA